MNRTVLRLGFPVSRFLVLTRRADEKKVHFVGFCFITHACFTHFATKPSGLAGGSQTMVHGARFPHSTTAHCCRFFSSDFFVVAYGPGPQQPAQHWVVLMRQSLSFAQTSMS